MDRVPVEKGLPWPRASPQEPVVVALLADKVTPDEDGDDAENDGDRRENACHPFQSDLFGSF